MSRSAIGKHISKLEYEFKSKLFIRHPRSVELTKEGLALYLRAEKILTEYDLAMDDFSDFGINSGKIYISASPTWANNLISDNILPFVEQHPDIKIHVNGSLELPVFNPSILHVGIYPSPFQEGSASFK